jgi:hypothetical protein
MSISSGRFFFYPAACSMRSMQTVQDTRRQRLAMLKKKHGKWSDINQALGWEKTNARLSQIMSGTMRSDRGTPYTMGDDTAREIEQKLGLPAGWMDTPPSYSDIHGQDDPISKAVDLMAAMEPEARYQALRLLGAIAQPPQANGTNHH